MIHHQVHRMCRKYSPASFYLNSLTMAKSTLLTSLFISLWKFKVEVWLDKCIEKYQFKPIG